MSRVRHRQRGIVLFISLIIALLMMVWAVAATHRANFQSNATLFSYRKSEAYYLAKTALSRGLNSLNTNPGWLATHSGRSNADTSTPDTAVWAEVSGAQVVLRCEATVETQTTMLSVPVKKLEASDTHIYSIAPSLNGGPDLIAWTTELHDRWETLPPIPGPPRIISCASTPNTDVYALAQASDGKTTLWRYRSGQGWMQMPDTPSGVTLSAVSAGGDKRVVCQGTSNNSLMILPLDSSLVWDTVPAPTGTSLSDVAADPTGRDYVHVTGITGATESIYVYDLGADSWRQLPQPPPVSYDPVDGTSLPPSGPVPNLSGGLAVDSGGRVFVASNPPGEASVVYRFDTTSPGSTSGSWTALPPVPAFQWQGGSLSNPTGFATNLSHLQADDAGSLWVQWSDPASNAYSTIQLEADPP